MITYADLVRALNVYLGTRYPGMGLYGNDTSEGWKKPYFFIECVPYECKYQTRNYVKRSCSMKVTYFQKTVNELEQLETVEEIRVLLGMKFCVGDRKLDVNNYTYDYVGEYNNILQISFDLNWFDKQITDVQYETIGQVNVSLEKGEL